MAYPNPADGTRTVYVHVPLTSVSDVSVKLFTTAFRKVQETDIPNQGPLPLDVPLLLRDQHGIPLANGLYYIVVTAEGNRSVTKLLVLK